MSDFSTASSSWHSAQVNVDRILSDGGMPMRLSQKQLPKPQLLTGMFVFLIGSVSTAQPPLLNAEQILDRAQEATGFIVPEPSSQIFAVANVSVDSENFQTIVHSAFDGRVRMEQHPFNFIAGVGNQGDWLLNGESGKIEELGQMLSFVRGHELHMLALYPRSRLLINDLLGSLVFAEKEALTIRSSLPGGDSVVSYYDKLTYLPLGLLFESQQPEIFVYFSNWHIEGDYKVFRRADIHQGDVVFTYDFTTVVIEKLEPSNFEPPVGNQDV